MLKKLVTDRYRIEPGETLACYVLRFDHHYCLTLEPGQGSPKLYLTYHCPPFILTPRFIQISCQIFAQISNLDLLWSSIVFSVFLALPCWFFLEFVLDGLAQSAASVRAERHAIRFGCHLVSRQND